MVDDANFHYDDALGGRRPERREEDSVAILDPLRGHEMGFFEAES